MKTVTAFLGTSHKTGFTFLATRRFLEDLESRSDIHTEIVFLSDCNLGVCRGCKACFLRGEEHCPFKDDRDLLIEKMVSSDGVVFASPNYSFQVSAVMKIFLDRLGFVFHRPCFHGRTFTCIVVQGIYGGEKVVKYLEFVGNGMGFNVVKGVCITALDPMTEQDERKMDEALTQLGARFHARLFKAALPAPSVFQLMAFRMGRTMVKQDPGGENRDYAWYRDHGWFDSDYYYPTRLGPLKKAVGAAFDWLAARRSRPRKNEAHA